MAQLRLTTHSTGRAISKPLIEGLGGFGGLCAPVNSGVRHASLSQRCNPCLSLVLSFLGCLTANKLRIASSVGWQCKVVRLSLSSFYKISIRARLVPMIGGLTTHSIRPRDSNSFIVALFSLLECFMRGAAQFGR